MTAYCNIHSHFPPRHPDDKTIINKIIKKEVRGGGEKEFSFLSVGIHPWYIENPSRQLQQLEETLRLPNVVAIGEAGIDKLVDTPMNIQQEVFFAQARLAERVQKPLIIHCVKAWQELLAIRKQIRPTVPWIIHGFRGNARLAAQLIRQGLHLSFGEHFDPKALAVAWPDHLLAETDDKGADICAVYQQIATSLKIDAKTLALQITKNARIFGADFVGCL